MSKHPNSLNKPFYYKNALYLLIYLITEIALNLQLITRGNAEIIIHCISECSVGI